MRVFGSITNGEAAGVFSEPLHGQGRLAISQGRRDSVKQPLTFRPSSEDRDERRPLDGQSLQRIATENPR